MTFCISGYDFYNLNYSKYCAYLYLHHNYIKHKNGITLYKLFNKFSVSWKDKVLHTITLYNITLHLFLICSIWNLQRSFSKIKDEGTNSTPKKQVTSMPPMNEAVQGLPTPIYASLKDEHQSTQITTLSNGITVASENRFGEFCTVGGEDTFQHSY